MNILAMSRGAWIALGIGAVVLCAALSLVYALFNAIFRAYMAAFEVK